MWNFANKIEMFRCAWIHSVIRWMTHTNICASSICNNSLRKKMHFLCLQFKTRHTNFTLCLIKYSQILCNSDRHRREDVIHFNWRQQGHHIFRRKAKNSSKLMKITKKKTQHFRIRFMIRIAQFEEKKPHSIRYVNRKFALTIVVVRLGFLIKQSFTCPNLNGLKFVVFNCL